MTIMQSKKHNSGIEKRIIAVFVLLAVLMIMAVSETIAVHEATEHNCSKENCPVCALIRISESNTRQFSVGAPVSGLAVPLIFTVVAIQLVSGFAVAAVTPVSVKIRLNN